MSVTYLLPVAAFDSEMNLRLSGPGGPCAVSPSPNNSASTQHQQCPQCARARTLTPHELEKRMRHGSPFLLLDCRSFIAYNLQHINGALNVSCADRFTKRRLAGGRTSVGEIVSGNESAKDVYQEFWESDFVLYDDNTQNPAMLGPTSPIHVVLEALAKEGKEEAFVLKGGLQAFQFEFSDLCGKTATSPDRQPRLVSPTTPVIHNKIDSTTATEILPFLFLGNERDARDASFLKANSITHVLNVTSHVAHHFENEGVVYKRLAVTDSCHQNLHQYFKEAFEFIDGCRLSGGRVLVHCQAGVSRSATVVLAYLMKKSSLSMTDAYRYLKNKRDIIAPNFNFMGQLMEFEQALLSGEVSRDLDSPLPVMSCV